jgi:hypothetical protein
MLKRRYTTLAAASGDDIYKTLRSNAADATTVTEHALQANHALGTNLSTYSSGLKQYKLVVNSSNFSNLTSNQVINNIVAALKVMLQRELINLPVGIGAMSNSSVTDAITANTAAAESKTVNRHCLHALMTESGTIDINSPASVRGKGVQDFIDALSSASDGGQHIHNMLESLQTTGSANSESMIHVNGDTLYIGIRRITCTTASPDNNTNFVPDQLQNQINVIAEKLMNAAKGMIRIQLLDSEL